MITIKSETICKYTEISLPGMTLRVYYDNSTISGRYSIETAKTPNDYGGPVACHEIPTKDFVNMVDALVKMIETNHNEEDV